MDESTDQNGTEAGRIASPSVTPGDGERSATGGYYAQYRTGAWLILSNLRQGRLEWIRVADPEAGRVDDFQIGSEGRVDAYQVKSTQYGGLFTFNDLTAPQAEKPALIAQLAQGWLTLGQKYPQSSVVVHLITNQTVSNSPNAQIPTGDVSPTPKHLSAFVEQVWRPAHLTPSDASLRIPAEWQATWDALRAASGLTDKDFEAFVRDCSLEFGFEARVGFWTESSPDQQNVADDVADITSFLVRTVADPQRIIEISLEELLQRLNWTDRFKYRNRHRFPVEERMYRGIEPTAAALTEAIDKLPGGYIAVLGTPGSGKSTLLTQTLRNLDARLVSYYAYVPDEAGSRRSRGESVNFLHDVVLRLESAGFRVGDSPSRLDRSQLLERFHEQLQRLHRDWEKTGLKTVILVDGLDHVEREQHPAQSLVSDFPDPDQVPNGVYFVLGTQTDAPLSGQIKAEVRRPCRRVEMQPLGRQQVHEIITAAETPTAVTLGQMDRAYDLSSGHPLYLNYLINRMRLCSEAAQLELELRDGEPYDGDIERTYHSYWEQFNDNPELRNLLGLLARIRGYIDLAWVRTWADGSVVEKLGQRFAHYFRIEDNTRWHFFHNSFRLFLVDKTAEFPPGTPDPSRHLSFHNQLADRCAEAGPDHLVWAWEELHHRAAAKQHAKVLELATQGYFRGQFFAFRPVDAIRSDIMAALGSAAACKDSVAFARLCLADSEMSQRGNYRDEGALVPLLIRLGQQDIALEQIRSGTRLRVSNHIALGVVKLLMEQGRAAEARQIFEIAEPLDLLPGSMSMASASRDISYDLLHAWTQAAVLFNDVDVIVDNISRLRYEYNAVGQVRANRPDRSLRTDLLSDTGLELLEQERWSDLTKLLGAFDLSSLDGKLARFWLHFHAYQDRYRVSDEVRAREHLDGMLCIDRDCLGPEELTVLAECVWRLLGDDRQAKELIEGLPQPELQTNFTGLDGGLSPFEQRFILNRLSYVLGDRRPPVDMIADTKDPRYEGIVVLERAICTVAQIWAKAWLEEQVSVPVIQLTTLPLLRLFYGFLEDTGAWTTSHGVLAVRGKFYELLIDAAAAHGNEVLKGLRDLFDLEWRDSNVNRYWPASVRRSVIQSFVKTGSSRQWANAALLELDGSVPDQDDVHSRVEECMKQAEAWLDVGDQKRAQHFLKLALELGFGVGYRKDYQMNQWIDWLDKINEMEPEKAILRTSHFAHAVKDLEESTDGGAANSAAVRLIAGTFHWSPVRATQLLFWFADRGIINYWRGIDAFLKEASKAPDLPMRTLLLAAGEFLLPFDTAGDAGLISDLVERLGDSEDEDQLITGIHALISKVRLHARPSVRPTWFKGLMEGVHNAGLTGGMFEIDADDLKDDEEQRYISGQLTLSGLSEPMDYSEVQESVTSVSDLRQLLEQEAEESFFDWVPLMTHVVRRESDEGILAEMADLFRNSRRPSQVLSQISMRLTELGNDCTAWEIGKEALELSSGFDWHPRFDGGSRVVALQALSRIDQDKTIPLVYDTLVQDLKGIDSLVTVIAEVLPDILELLGSSVPVDDIWSEIEDHTEALLGLSWSAPPPDVFDDVSDEDTPHRALIELMAAHLDHPCRALAQAAQRSLGQLLLDGASDVPDVLMNLLEQSDEQQERVLMLVDAVSSIDSNAATDLRDPICRLSNSPNWLVRTASRAIIGNCGWPTPETVSRLIRPHPIYNLILPALDPGQSLAALLPSPGATMPDSEDSVRIVAPFTYEIGLIAEVGGVPVENLYKRVVEIMEQLAPRDLSWSEEAERRLRIKLSSAGIRLPFVRPRARVARTAMFHAVSELVDTGALSAGSVSILGPMLRTYDPWMIIAEPAQRPKLIPRMNKTQISSDATGWVRNVVESLPHLGWEPDDQRLVLAEETRLEIRTNDRSSAEIRYAIMETGSGTQQDLAQSPEMIFASTSRKLASEYTTLNNDAENPPLVLCHHGYNYDSPGANWLALSPVIARRLGWSIAKEGIFRWVDDQNRLMVESIWWVDGRPNLSMAGMREDEVGEGWLVLASESAWEQIQSECGSLLRKSIVVREHKEGSETTKCQAVC